MQSKDCRVSNHWRCVDGPTGNTWTADFGVNGPISSVLVNREYLWLSNYFFEIGLREVLLSDDKDTMSLTELFDTKFDSYDVSFTYDYGNGENTSQLRGFDWLLSETVVIDGEPLERTRYQMEMTDQDGTIIYNARGFDFVSKKHRVFFSGTGVFVDADGVVEYDDPPVDFVYPGEPGFMSETPLYNCASVMSSLSIDPSAPAKNLNHNAAN